jgi:hypothetical protein
MSVHVVLNAQALLAMLCFQAEFDGKKMVKAAEERMVKSMDKCKENMATLRTGAIQHNTASTLQTLLVQSCYTFSESMLVATELH